MIGARVPRFDSCSIYRRGDATARLRLLTVFDRDGGNEPSIIPSRAGRAAQCGLRCAGRPAADVGDQSSLAAARPSVTVENTAASLSGAAAAGPRRRRLTSIVDSLGAFG